MGGFELEKTDMWVFGTGYVAKVFCIALQEKCLLEQVKGFVVTETMGKREFMNRPVISLKDYQTQILRSTPQTSELFVAVHESIIANVREQLAEQGLSGIWVYPFLYDLLYGEPVADAKEIFLEEILQRQNKDYYWIAARYAAAKQYLSERSQLHKKPPRQTDNNGTPQLRANNDKAADCKIYLKALSQFSSSETSKKRLHSFCSLIDSIVRDGFDKNKPVFLDENYRIIDGLHRIALAKLLGEKTITCRIYTASPLYDKVLDQRNFLSRAILNSSDFTEEEIRELERCQCELFSQSNR